MRWSRQFIPTLREVPQEAEIPSHRLMLRAGLIRRLSGGLYTFLPLGLRSLRKVEQIVREEMDRAGALEILMPALQPADIWQRTGRLEAMGGVMFHIRDRQGRAMVLGPTHEEVTTLLAAQDIDSYRQLPRTFYQVQTKFRDEIRPRFGLMRAKEFIMKDAYSFDVDEAGVDASYEAMRAAYVRIFARCGLRTRVVEADTGAMGGRDSQEFMVLAEAGEDGVIDCPDCGYAANLERAEGRPPALPVVEGADGPSAEVETPGARTVEQVAAFLEVSPRQLVKTLIYLADDRPVAVLVPGDREVNEIKLQRALGAGRLALADEARIVEVTGAPVGFAGPAGLDLPKLADESLRGARGCVTGANRADAHRVRVDLARDAGALAYADLVFPCAGDGCPRCADGRLREERGIEVGHVFKLGTKYAEALGASVLDEGGRRRPPLMGCYGVGVTRTLQAVIEQRHDAQGICWPAALAPYPVGLLCLNTRDAACAAAADALYAALIDAGVEVLYDDRDERPGVKFKDADLVGFPLRVAVGERGLSRGVVEIRERATGVTDEAPPEAAAERIRTRLAELVAKESADGA